MLAWNFALCPPHNFIPSAKEVPQAQMLKSPWKWDICYWRYPITSLLLTVFLLVTDTVGSNLTKARPFFFSFLCNRKISPSSDHFTSPIRTSVGFDLNVLFCSIWNSSSFHMLIELLIGIFVCPQQIYELKEIDFVILVYSLGAACLELGGHEV